jgi:Protein of unknown function (DUF3866)
MAAFARGTVSEILESSPALIKVRVDRDGRAIVASGFPHMLGPVRVGDAVVVNTLGIDLDLGTGGEGFILWNLDGPGPRRLGPGHIVKLRYTPWQMEVLAAEAPESPHHNDLRDAISIEGVPVVACGLHSQVAGVAAGIKADSPGARVGYLMTDGAALPLAWSGLVAQLKEADLIDVTCTAGHAFGGDFEAVNIYSGLAALRRAGGVDAVVVAMGPGVVGTDTALGFSAMEQGQVLDAATALRGTAIACVRISFAEERARHRGVSHHTLTALTIAARERALVALPELPRSRLDIVMAQVREAGLERRHDITVADGAPGVELMRTRGVSVTSMGRSAEEVPELFLAGAAAGRVAASRL